MKIVIAPNAFKNSLPAPEVAKALQEGLRSGGFTGEIVCQPVADGGDGTGALLRQNCTAETFWLEVDDPLQRKVKAPLGWIPATHTAIIEMADASGLKLLAPEEYNPLVASTRGCGQLIKKALDLGAAEIILCVGGSATVDGGAGILKELGMIFRNDLDLPITQLPSGLIHLKSIDGTRLDERLKQVRIVIICDVANTLLGEKGAAFVFGPQKGATSSDVVILNTALEKLSFVVAKITGIDIARIEGGGAAGGVPAGLFAFGNVSIVQGSSFVLQKIGFENVLDQADVVITGEGSIDRQTLEGKAPYAVAQMAKKKGIKVIGVAGSIPLKPDTDLDRYFDQLIAINKVPIPLAEALGKTEESLIRAGRDIAGLLAGNNST